MKLDAERRGMHSHAERGNEKRRAWERETQSVGTRTLVISRSHALRGNACCDALRRYYKTLS